MVVKYTNVGKVIQFALMFNIVLLFGCGKKTEGNEGEVIKYVKIGHVSDNYGNEQYTFNGSIKENSLTSLSFRVGGKLADVKVNVGDYVKAGQVLASLDKRDYQLQVQSTEAQYKQLKGEYGRYKELFEKGKIPANSFEKIESGYVMAKTAYENAVNQLGDSDLKAPISGYIHEKLAENFEMVAPGRPIFSIIDLSRLEVVISVPENQLKGIEGCDASYLEVKNADVHNLPIYLTSMGEKAKKDGLYEVRLSFKNDNKLKVFPGMTAQVNMACKGGPKNLSVPSTAVFNNDNQAYVWKYNESTGSITKQAIETGRIKSGGRLEVVSGLSPTDVIVTSGVNSLEENQKVQPIKKPSATNVGGLL